MQTAREGNVAVPRRGKPEQHDSRVPQARCPECGALANTRLDPYTKQGPRQISNHRHGGGGVRLLRGDTPCMGVGRVADL